MKIKRYAFLFGVIILSLALIGKPSHAQDGESSNGCEGEGKATCIATVAAAFENIQKLDNYGVNFTYNSDQRIRTGEDLLAVNINQQLNQTISGSVWVGDGELSSQTQASVGNGTTEVVEFDFSDVVLSSGSYLAEVNFAGQLIQQDFYVIQSPSEDNPPSTNDGDTPPSLVLQVGTGPLPTTLNPAIFFYEEMPIRVSVVLHNNTIAGEATVRLIDTEDSTLNLTQELFIYLATNTAPTISRLTVDMLQVNNQLYLKGRQTAGSLPYQLTENWQNVANFPEAFPGLTIFNGEVLQQFNYAQAITNGTINSITQNSETSYTIEYLPSEVANSLNWQALFAESQEADVQAIANTILASSSIDVTQTVELILLPDSETEYVVSSISTSVFFNVDLPEELTGRPTIQLRQEATTVTTMDGFNEQAVIYPPDFRFGS